MKRRLFIASSVSAALTGCGPIANTVANNPAWQKILNSVEPLNHGLIGTRGLAREYADSAVDREFRVNGFAPPGTTQYARLVAGHFNDYRLVVNGAVDRPQAFAYGQLLRMPRQTQTTRHDCVEGWSCIAKWTGTRLGPILDQAVVAMLAKAGLDMQLKVVDDATFNAAGFGTCRRRRLRLAVIASEEFVRACRFADSKSLRARFKSPSSK